VQKMPEDMSLKKDQPQATESYDLSSPNFSMSS
jgi:hypothetical protein